MGVPFEQQSADIDETLLEGESPDDYVVRMSVTKCQYLHNKRNDCLILGSDTIVVVDNQVLGKPKDQRDHTRMLMQLSARTHQVFSAVTLMDRRDTATSVSQSFVTFREITLNEIVSYWHSKEPRDKAGGYAIQGIGAVFVKSLSGSYSGVMGLPVFETAQLLERFNYPLLGR